MAKFLNLENVMNDAVMSMRANNQRRSSGSIGLGRRKSSLHVAYTRIGFMLPAVIGGGAIVLGILFWNYMAQNGIRFILNFNNVPTPQAVGAAFWGALQTRDFYMDIGVSLLRIAGSFLMAAFFGILIGVSIGRFKFARWAFLPYIEIMRPIPAITWIPMAILIWPTTEESILFITFLGAFFPIVLNTIQGVEATPKALINAAKTLGANEWDILRHVILPASLPSITSGAAIGMGVSWFSLVAGEMIGGRAGIGYYTWNAYQLIQYSNIIVGMITIGILSTISTWIIYGIRYPLLKWQRS
jgi:NitT/TauT family transport system permease protein